MKTNVRQPVYRMRIVTDKTKVGRNIISRQSALQEYFDELEDKDYLQGIASTCSLTLKSLL